MIDVTAIELHDARIDSAVADFVSGTLKARISYYEKADTQSRTDATLIFEGVHSFSQIVSFGSLSKNRVAGNVNYWVPVEKNGTTYIYLSDGCIAVTADSLRVENMQKP